ncbi:MAG TPA: TonB-dependent receptor [Spongiibacteraceae bacterium]|nr:TonB-dependent receptor [Spongiibacteraceae bacterium]
MLVGGIGFSLLALNTSAADGPPPKAGQLEEVVVMARKVTESLQDAPLAVTAVSALQMQNRGVLRITELSGVAPSVYFTEQPGHISGYGISIRGISAQDPVLTLDPSVSLYLDGVNLARSSSAGVFSLVNIESIEILRGPQGTLFGRNTTGGAINIITSKPADTFGFDQTFTFGSYDQFLSRTSLESGALLDDHLRMTLAYQYQRRDGYVDNPVRSDSRGPGSLDSSAVFASAEWRFSDNLTARYSFDYNDREGHPAAFQLVAVSPDVGTYLAASPSFGGTALVTSHSRLQHVTINGDDRVDATNKGHALHLDWQVGDFTLRSISAYRRWDSPSRATDLDGNGVFRGAVLDPVTFAFRGIEPLSLYQAYDRKQHQKQFSQEFQWLGQFEHWSFVTGLYYFDEDVSEFAPSNITVVLPGGGAALVLNNTTDYEGTSKSKAAYGQLTWSPPILDRKLEITAGARYTKDEKSLYQNDLSFGVPKGARDLDKDFNDVGGALTFNYHWTDNVSTYALVSSAYKAGGFNPRSNNDGFDPEDAVSGEIGIKSEWLDRRLRFNGDIYYTKYSDLQVQQFEAGSGGATSVTVNAGEARYLGIEGELTALISDGLTVQASLGYVDPKYNEFLFLDKATNQIIDVASEAKFPYMSKTTASLSADWVVTRMFSGELRLYASATYVGTQYWSPLERSGPFLEDIKGKPHTLINGRLTLADMPMAAGQVSVALWGKNLTDKEYRASGIDFGAVGFAGVTYGEPRTVGIDFQYQY